MNSKASRLFSLAELERAADVVYGVMAPTPQYAWPLLATQSGCEVWVKHENHTPTGAFKVRGGLVFLEQLHRQNRLPRGFVTATRGNHGQSIPFAARRHGVPVTVVVPRGNSEEKNQAMQAWGAELVVHGDDFDEARLEAARLAQARGLMFAPSFHPALVLGVATYALELFRAAPDLDVVYAPIGMGSGIYGLIGTRDLLGLATEIVGVVSAHAPAFARSVEQGTVVETATARTFADGMACRVPMPEAFDVIRRGVSRIVEVTDDQVAEAMRDLYRATHNVAEGAGAAAMAALTREQDAQRGRRVAVALTGGNVDSDVLATVLAGGTPLPA
ncbi:MAG: threonine dehydratase [Pseudomonadales bacterium]